MTELTQTLVNAVLLIGVALIAGSIGLKRFEAIDRRIEDLRTELRGDMGRVDDRLDHLRTELQGDIGRVDDRLDQLRTELKADIGRVDGHVGELRAEVAQVRSDLTYVALAVGARRSEGSA